MNTEIIANIILAFCFGFVIAIFITPVFVYLKKVMYYPFLNKKLLEEVQKKENIVIAKKIKEHDIYDHSNNNLGAGLPNGEKMASYEYNYNGKTYRRRFLNFNYMADEVQLYFISDPGKATFGGKLWATKENHWIKSYFLMVLLCSIISFFVLMFK